MNAAAPVGEIVSLTGSLQDVQVIRWRDGHCPKVGDRLYSAPMQEWQPIETAPHDGAGILLYQRWRSGHDTILIGHYANGWVNRDCDELQPEPTHWMPLPDAPICVNT